MKNKLKKYKKFFILFSFLVLYFCSFYQNVSADFFYTNPSGGLSNICATTLDACNGILRLRCSSAGSTSCVDGGIINTCGSTVPSVDQATNNSSFQPYVCPAASSTNSYSTSSTYTLLAPLPGGLTTAPNNFGEYANKVFLIIIGLCGALAVIMLIIGGIMYMGDESIFGKTEAKKQMENAIFGLLIALAAYVLLNTINPDLLNANLSVTPVTADITESTATAISSESALPPLGQAVNQCTGGIAAVVVNGATVMHACSSISSKLSDLLTQAKNAGLNLTGSSYRSTADQMALRTKNCADPINTAPNLCKPPTAYAGQSLHESGLAIDFMCDGTFIQNTTNKCYVWLQQNAGTIAGLKNLSSEPWHWSTTGN